MKNKKVNLNNVAGGINFRKTFGKAAGGLRSGVNRLIESEFGHKMGKKGQDILNKLLGKLEQGIEKGINKKIGQAESYIDSKFS